MRRRRPSDETLVTLRRRLADLPARSPERQRLLQGCADLHGVSIATVYRALREQFRPRSLHRRDRGRPAQAATAGDGAVLRVGRGDEAAHHEPEEPAPLDRPRHRAAGRARDRDAGRLGAAAAWPAQPHHVEPLSAELGLDHERMARPPPAVRFQAEHSNDCWQFDLSPVGPEAGAGAALGRGRPRPADPDAVQRRRRPQRRRLSGIPLRLRRGRRRRAALPVQRHGARRTRPAWCFRASRRCSIWTMARSPSPAPSGG